MSQEQLRDAYKLLKDGEKRQAAMIVKGVLRQNSENADAWWLMANILEDEDKVVNALQRVLKIRRDHKGARKKLASLRTEYANLAPSPFDDDVKRVTSSADEAQTTGSAGLIAIVAGVIVLIAGAVGAFALLITNIDNTDSSSATLLSDTIDMSTDDVHEVSLNAAGLVTITARGANSFDPRIYLFGEDGFYVLGENDDHADYAGLSVFDSAIENVRIGEGAVIGIEEFSGDSGRVTVTVTQGNANAISEGTIAVGDRLTDQLEAGGALEFIINSTDRVDISVDSDDIDPLIIVFDEDGNIIGHDDDSGGDLNAQIENLQLSGRAIIHIRDYWNDSGGDLTITVD